MSSMDTQNHTFTRGFSGKALRLSSVLLLSTVSLAPLYAESGPNAPVAETWNVPSELRDPTEGNVPAAIDRWRLLRASNNYSFGEYARFLVTYPGWPDETAMRKAAESAYDLDAHPPEMVVGYFDRFEPLTNAGRAKYALMLARSGDPRAADWAVKAWRGGPMSEADEAAILSQFGGMFGPKEHEDRMDALLFAGANGAANRQIQRVHGPRRASFDAALALKNKSSDAYTLSAAASMTEPAFVAEQAKFMAGQGDIWGARSMLANRPPLATPPADAEKWYEMLLFSARKSAEAGRYDLAYGIASKLDDGVAAGTDLSTAPLKVRDHYTSLAWLAGRAAMNELGRPADAIGMFARYGDAAKSPQTKAKGYYWAARAANAAGDGQARAEYLNKAAAYPDQYYGMLANEDLGRPLPDFTPTAAARAGRADPQNRPLYMAALMAGSRSEQATFVRAIGNGAKSEADHRDAIALADTLGRPDLAVIAGRNARIEGYDSMIGLAFPAVDMPPGHEGDFALSHAIMRQESQFDRTAISHAGARGMMQLMPPTANEVARGLGLPYDRTALTEDPLYNITLGSTYITKMLRYYNGHYVLAVAAYNAGPGNVNKWIRANGDPRMPGVDIVAWVEDIPVLETRNYVQRVLENLVMYDAVYPTRAHSNHDRPLSGYLGR